MHRFNKLNFFIHEVAEASSESDEAMNIMITDGMKSSIVIFNLKLGTSLS